MIDLTRESPVTFEAAPALVPAINSVAGMEARRSLNPRTIYNWASRGKRGVILESAAIGGILVTTREALQRFFQRLSAVREERLLNQRFEQHQSTDTSRRTPRRSTQRNLEARERLQREHGV
jgi:Protein of unknown function (DUF1580)